MSAKPRYAYWKILLALLPLALMYAGSQYVEAKGDSDIEPEITETIAAGALLRFLYHITFLYFGMNAYYRLIADNRGWKDFLVFAGKIILASFALHTLLYYQFPALLLKTYDFLPDLLCSRMKGMIPMLIFCYLFAYLTNMREALQQRRVFEAQRLQLEMETSQANFNFLKAQINPHFLHNTLNFLYAKSLPYSEELSEGILTLSDIMRYALSQGNQKDGKAPLNNEVEHVYNVIKISQLRYSNALRVQFDVRGAIEGTMIVPFVLITIVENAFKHGELKDPEHPVVIRLEVEEGQLYFYCRNKKKPGPKPFSTGIGLDNIKKQLELAYGAACQLTIKDEAEFYTTELRINGL